MSMTISLDKTPDEALRGRELSRLEEQRDKIAEICRRYGVARLSLFGSLAKAGRFGPQSDVDLLVEFLPGVRHGFSFFAMEGELEDLLGRRTQLLTALDISHYFRDEVATQAQEIYHAEIAGAR